MPSRKPAQISRSRSTRPVAYVTCDASDRRSHRFVDRHRRHQMADELLVFFDEMKLGLGLPFTQKIVALLNETTDSRYLADETFCGLPEK
jgi:hypothetical protein